MVSLSEVISHWQLEGYTENLTPRFDHFECQNGSIKMYPENFEIDEVERFENTSDPNDQSILYALSSVGLGIKGLYVDSYGAYHDDLSPLILEKFKSHFLRISD